MAAGPLEYHVTRRRPHSVAGIVSCTLAGMAVLSLVSAAAIGDPSRSSNPDLAVGFALLGVAVMLGAPVLGLVFGVVGVVNRRGRRRLLAVVGLALNGLVVLFFAMVFVVAAGMR